MDEELKKRLAEEEQDEKLVALRDKVVKCVKRSRSDMSQNYEKWDRNNDTYRGLRAPDEEDVNAKEHGEPEKMIVPMTFAQVQTFVSFTFLLYHQNRRFYELEGTGSEDMGEKASNGEKLLAADMRANEGSKQVYQFLTNIGRFSIGVMKSWWDREMQSAPTNIAPATTDAEGFAFQSPGEQSEQDFLKYEGNKFTNISPYNFFPDTRFPLSEWRKGAFVADETEWHINELKKQDEADIVAGVEHIEPMEKKAYETRKHTRLDAFHEYAMKGHSEKSKDDQIVCITECQIDIVPEKYGFTGKRLTKYVVQIANDERIIRAEPLGYLHDQPTYDVGLMSPDMHQQVGQSLADSIDPIQEVISFLINARLMSNRKGLENNMIIDPTMIDMSTVESRSPWILTKKSAPKLGVDRFAKQLNYVDHTASNFADAEVLMKVMQVVTGVNENAMGQFHGGRRSATEARAVNSGSAARMKVTAKLIWDMAFDPLGQKMISNHRQGISLEGWKKVIGENTDDQYAAFKPSDPSQLVGMRDHFVYDSTLESEKGFIAQSLQELVSAMMATPEVMAILNVDLEALITEILRLRGIENVDRFQRQPQLPNGTNPLGSGQIGPGQGGTGEVQGQPALPAIPGGIPGS